MRKFHSPYGNYYTALDDTNYRTILVSSANRIYLEGTNE